MLIFYNLHSLTCTFRHSLYSIYILYIRTHNTNELYFLLKEINLTISRLVAKVKCVVDKYYMILKIKLLT